MKILLTDPKTVVVSPPHYGEDPAGRWWGFFQFPDLWRGNDGALYLAVNIGVDSAVGCRRRSSARTTVGVRRAAHRPYLTDLIESNISSSGTIPYFAGRCLSTHRCR
jgi:hypothetical protein